jgi:hypothetical protein
MAEQTPCHTKNFMKIALIKKNDPGESRKKIEKYDAPL